VSTFSAVRIQTGDSAEQIQSSNWGGDLREAQIDVPVSAILAFDRTAGLTKKTLKV